MNSLVSRVGGFSCLAVSAGLCPPSVPVSPIPGLLSPFAPCKEHKPTLTLPLLSPLQGLYIFLVYAVYNSEVRDGFSPCSQQLCAGSRGSWVLAAAAGSTAPLCCWSPGCFFCRTCWSISSCAGAAVALSHVLALLQVRNAIQRMKDKKKALSFTVSWEESLLPLHPSEEEEGPSWTVGLLWGDDDGKKSYFL